MQLGDVRSVLFRGPWWGRNGCLWCVLPCLRKVALMPSGFMDPGRSDLGERIQGASQCEMKLMISKHLEPIELRMIILNWNIIRINQI
jgi:hypothetical protein